MFDGISVSFGARRDINREYATVEDKPSMEVEREYMLASSRLDVM
jgi:hypothetical protein